MPFRPLTLTQASRKISNVSPEFARNLEASRKISNMSPEFAGRVYGVQPWQVVGTSVKTEYRLDAGKGEIIRLPDPGMTVNGPGKALGINGHIGLRPIAAFGNSDGDIEMLEYTDSGSGRRLMMLVHHDDPEREYSYTCDTQVGRLCKGLELAKERGWILISMKRDWKTLFPFEADKP